MPTRQQVLLVALNEAGGFTDKKIDEMLCPFAEEIYNNALPFYSFNYLSGKPKSLELNNDIERLVKGNILQKYKSKIILTAEGKKKALNIDSNAYLTIASILKNTFACNCSGSLRNKNATNKIYTIGYEGHSVDTFFGKLKKTGIKRIIDVRKNPISRKYGFSKKYLTEFSRLFGMEYVHYPALGIPSEDRKLLGTEESYRKLLDEYERTILAENKEAREVVALLIKAMPSTLLCFEADPNYCHRGRLAKKLARDIKLEVEHI